MRRNLVITRVGDTSVHPGWLGDGAERNWDLIVNYYGNDPNLFRAPDVRRIDSKGAKWPGLYDLVISLGTELDAYDYIWFPDDDLVSDPQSINRFFDICREFNLSLAQPALSSDSIIGCPITRRNTAFRLRYTNFVEIMAPCFSQAFFRRCRPAFNTNISGQGLDMLWPNWAGPDKAGIIDEVTVRHLRSRGALYDVFAALGVRPELENAALLAKEKILPIPMIFGGIDLEGKLHALWNNGHQQLIRHIMKGWLPDLADNGELLYQLIAPILVFLGENKNR